MSHTIEQEMRALENLYWNAIQAKDENTAMSLSDEQCVVVGSLGVRGEGWFDGYLLLTAFARSLAVWMCS